MIEASGEEIILTTASLRTVSKRETVAFLHQAQFSSIHRIENVKKRRARIFYEDSPTGQNQRHRRSNGLKSRHDRSSDEQGPQ